MKKQERKFALRAVMSPQGKPVAYLPYREWRQAELLAARLSARDRNRAELGAHFINVVKVTENQLAALTA